MDLFSTRTLPFLTRRNYFFEMQHMLTWSVLAGLVEGQFASIVIAKSFGGSSTLIAWATATPFAAMMFSMFWGALCVGRPKVRLFTRLCTGMALLSGVVFAIPSTPWGAIWFIVQMAAAQVLLAGIITIRAAVWKSNYPREVRGMIVARLQGVREAVMVVSSMLAAATCTIDAMSYRYVYPIAAVIGSIGILAIRRLHIRHERMEMKRFQVFAGSAGAGGSAGPVRRASSTRVTPWLAGSPVYLLRTALRVLLDDRRFARYILAQLVLGVSNLMTLAVAIELIANSLTPHTGWSYWVSTALVVGLPRLVLIGAIQRWGRHFDRVGVIRFRVANVVCWLISLSFGLVGTLALVHPHPLGGFLAPGGVLLFAGWGFFFGLGFSGGRLAWNIGHLHFARHEDAEVYMGIHVSLTGIRGLIAPLAGMWLWTTVGWPVWLVAIALAFVSLIMFHKMAREEMRAQAVGERG